MFKKNFKGITKSLVAIMMVVAILTANFGAVFATDAEILAAQLGGSYNSIESAMGGERHHCFAGYVYNNTYVYKFDQNRQVTGYVKWETGPVILMTKSDHMQTASWGSSSAAQAYREQQLALVQQGRHLAAMQMDVDDIRSKFGSKYDEAISKMWAYATQELGWSK